MAKTAVLIAGVLAAMLCVGMAFAAEAEAAREEAVVHMVAHLAGAGSNDQASGSADSQVAATATATEAVAECTSRDSEGKCETAKADKPKEAQAQAPAKPIDAEKADSIDEEGDQSEGGAEEEKYVSPYDLTVPIPMRGIKDPFKLKPVHSVFKCKDLIDPIAINRCMECFRKGAPAPWETLAFHPASQQCALQHQFIPTALVEAEADADVDDEDEDEADDEDEDADEDGDEDELDADADADADDQDAEETVTALLEVGSGSASSASDASSAASDELADEEEEEVDEIMGMEEDTVAMHAAYRALNEQLANFRAAHKKELDANPPAPQHQTTSA